MAEPMTVHLQHSKRVATASAKTQVSANFKRDPVRLLTIEGCSKEVLGI